MLLTTALPFAIVGIITSLKSPMRNLGLRHLAIVVISYVSTLSLVSHKEARFVYPLIAPGLVLAAGPFSEFFLPLPIPTGLWKKVLLLTIIAVNLAMAIYVSYFHNRGVISVTSYLQEQFYASNTDLVLGNVQHRSLYNSAFGENKNKSTVQTIDVGFLMPCHSTPWRSHLLYPEIQAWALTCEPPLGLDGEERKRYEDKADGFYEDPVHWMETNMGPVLMTSDSKSGALDTIGKKADSIKQWMATKAWKGRRPWPRYVVFFGQLEADIRAVLGQAGSRYRECWRSFNSHWHDDWRRRGDVIVWCLDGSLSLEEELLKEEIEGLPFKP